GLVLAKPRLKRVPPSSAVTAPEMPPRRSPAAPSTNPPSTDDIRLPGSCCICAMSCSTSCSDSRVAMVILSLSYWNVPTRVHGRRCQCSWLPIPHQNSALTAGENGSLLDG